MWKIVLGGEEMDDGFSRTYTYRSSVIRRKNRRVFKVKGNPENLKQMLLVGVKT